ncbi:hypothetical protein CMO96_03855 [Candidatus Woesebacteria bacterium]|nr:hypothetical protein [Candidatus Woesebacteria bacterium]
MFLKFLSPHWVEINQQVYSEISRVVFHKKISKTTLFSTYPLSLLQQQLYIYILKAESIIHIKR